MGMTLREAREQRGWTPVELSTKSGVGRATVYRLESGETPNPAHSTVVRLEDALGVSRGTLEFGPSTCSAENGSAAAPVAMHQPLAAS